MQSVVQEIKDKTTTASIEEVKVEHDRYVLPEDFHRKVVEKEALLDILKYANHAEFTQLLCDLMELYQVKCPPPLLNQSYLFACVFVLCIACDRVLPLHGGPRQPNLLHRQAKQPQLAAERVNRSCTAAVSVTIAKTSCAVAIITQSR